MKTTFNHFIHQLSLAFRFSSLSHVLANGLLVQSSKYFIVVQFSSLVRHSSPKPLFSWRATSMSPLTRGRIATPGSIRCRDNHIGYFVELEPYVCAILLNVGERHFHVFRLLRTSCMNHNMLKLRRVKIIPRN